MTMILTTALLLAVSGPAADAPAPKTLTKAEVKAAIERGCKWLEAHQRDDGSYGSFQGDVGITALVVQALAISPLAYRESDGPFVSKAVDYLLAHVQPDGAIYDPSQGLMNYKTSVSVLALTALDEGREKKRYEKIVAKARDAILELQFDKKGDKESYGGIGYEEEEDESRPDLSNTQLALEALHAAGLAEDADAWKRVTVFLSRCQNRKASNDSFDDKHHSTEDGGFFYAPGESKAGVVKNPDGSISYKSYGSMTYAGLKSMVYAGLTMDDPRVKAAWDWIRGNYTLDVNPGMASSKDKTAGLRGLYYYYMTMARTLDVLGKKQIETSDGKSRNWARDLATKLISLQDKDGSWVNDVRRWWEADRTLATAYALRSLSIAYRHMEE